MHPTQPNPRPAIALLRKLFADKSIEEAEHFLPDSIKAQYAIRTTFLDACRLAETQGLHEDALWLGQKQRQIFLLRRPPNAVNWSNCSRDNNAQDDAPTFRKYVVWCLGSHTINTNSATYCTEWYLSNDACTYRCWDCGTQASVLGYA